MKEASLHVTFQVPTEHTRVGYLLYGIETDSPTLHATIATVLNDKGGTRKNFDDTVVILITSDPSTKQEALKAPNSVSFTIGSADGSGSPRTSRNSRCENTNIDLHWHTAQEFAALSRDKKTEFSTWQKTAEGKKATSDARNAHFKSKKRKRDIPDR